MNKKVIRQIIPADGWFALYAVETEKPLELATVEDIIVADRLACWALVDYPDGNDRGVEGIADAGGYNDYCEDVRNFLGYERGAIRNALAEHLEDARKMLRSLRKRDLAAQSQSAPAGQEAGE